MLEQSNPSIGRFDKSFLILMIKDFFLVLVAVMIIEFALKAGSVYWDYQSDGENQALEVADEVAENVVEIMTNAGGPVAARTIYPILEKNWEELGYEIAIVPTSITVDSIEQTFGFAPDGIPIEGMADEEHKTAAVEIRASEVCTSCHIGAESGDILGRVVVRNYLGRDFAMWWEDVKLTLGLAVGKILLHSVLLFLILRARMEPLLRLRAVVSRLSKAYTDLNQRAEVRTSDEFGVLARDLNVFLDRISRLVLELDTVLRKVVDVNDDIIQIQTDLRTQIDSVVQNTRTIERNAMLSAKREPRLSNAWFDAVKNSVAELDAELARANKAPGADKLLENLRAVVGNAEEQIKNSERMYVALAQLGDEAAALKGSMSEMTRLEERMKTIIETGSQLVGRLRAADNTNEAIPVDTSGNQTIASSR